MRWCTRRWCFGAVAAVCYARYRPVRMWFTWLTPVAVVFPVLFVAFSPVTALVLPAERALGPERVPIGNPAPIVFVVLDELPTTSLMDGEERIDAERYPNFAALARDATWYRRATTVAETTYDALPAILTGRDPQPEKLPHAIEAIEAIETIDEPACVRRACERPTGRMDRMRGPA